jgi:hypothetical protein
MKGSSNMRAGLIGLGVAVLLMTAPCVYAEPGSFDFLFSMSLGFAGKHELAEDGDVFHATRDNDCMILGFEGLFRQTEHLSLGCGFDVLAAGIGEGDFVNHRPTFDFYPLYVCAMLRGSSSEESPWYPYVDLRVGWNTVFEASAEYCGDDKTVGGLYYGLLAGAVWENIWPENSATGMDIRLEIRYGKYHGTVESDEYTVDVAHEQISLGVGFRIRFSKEASSFGHLEG